MLNPLKQDRDPSAAWIPNQSTVPLTSLGRRGCPARLLPSPASSPGHRHTIGKETPGRSPDINVKQSISTRKGNIIKSSDHGIIPSSVGLAGALGHLHSAGSPFATVCLSGPGFSNQISHHRGRAEPPQDQRALSGRTPRVSSYHGTGGYREEGR